MQRSDPKSHWKSQWNLGSDHFNQGRYWDAHEAWEQEWTLLDEPWKSQIQACIQGAAVFHLLKLGRIDPAIRLAGRALELRSQAEALGGCPQPCPQIPDLWPLLKIITESTNPESHIQSWLNQAAAVQVESW